MIGKEHSEQFREHYLLYSKFMANRKQDTIMSPDIRYNLEGSNLNVSGVGVSHVKPDRFRLSLSISLEHPDEDFIFKKVSADAEQLLSAIKEWASPSDAVRTSSFSVRHYEYDSKNGKWAKGQTITIVSTNIIVDSPRVDEVAKLITLAKRAGATSIHRVEFKLSDELRRQERKNALEKAVSAARFDAETVAFALGMTLVKPLTVTVESDYIHDTYARMSLSKSISLDEDDLEDCPEFIEAGEIATTINVDVVYGLV